MLPRNVVLLLFIGTLARVAVAPFFGHPWDIGIWTMIGEDTAARQINVYEVKDLVRYPWGYYVYPPTWLYWCAASYVLSSPFKNLNLYVALIKLPMIVADAAVGLLIWSIVWEIRKNERDALIAMAAWFLNPLTFFISSVWGMFDSLAVIFTVLAAYFFRERRYSSAGLSLGVGAAVKIFPAIFLVFTVPFLLFREKKTLRHVVTRHLFPFASFPLAVSIPYLTNPIDYIGKLLFHFSQLGQFSYWLPLSKFVNPALFGALSVIALFLLLFLFYRRIKNRSVEDLRRDVFFAFLVILLAFLGTSTKVNVQYVTWVLPFAIIEYFKEEERDVKTFLIVVTAAGTGFVIGSGPVVNYYSLDAIGKISMPRYELASLIGGGIVTFALAGSLISIMLLSKYLGLRTRLIDFSSRTTVFAFVAVFLIFFSLYPTPVGVALPDAGVRVGIPESIDTVFKQEPGFAMRSFERLYDVTHVVLPFGPDIVNTYSSFNATRPVHDFFRFWRGEFRWNQGDLALLVDALHASGYKVLLGVLMKPIIVDIHLGLHGYESTWMIERHPEVVNEEGWISFQASLEEDPEYEIEEGTTYSEYFSARSLRFLADFEMDGMYLLEWTDSKSSSFDETLGGMIGFAEMIRPRLSAAGKELFVEDRGDTLVHDRYWELLPHVDHLVLRTSPWVNTYYYVIENMTLSRYEIYVDRVLASTPPALRHRILYGVFAQDFSRGWTTPAVVLQDEVNRFSRIGSEKYNVTLGYAVYHTSRYLPYRLTVQYPS